MNKQKLMIAGLAGVAMTAFSVHGMNDRLAVGHSVDAHDKTQVSEQNENMRYDAMQPDNALKPVRTDVSSKDELDLNSQQITEQRYTVAPENKAKSFPNAAKTGECYGELVYPAEFRKVEERIISNAGHTEMEITPAQYEWTEQQVVVKEAETRLELVPATYKTVEERILVEPKRTVTEHVPATFRTEERRVLVEPATREWVDGDAAVDDDAESHMTGDVVCLIQSPARYETISVEMVDQPARTETRTIPAKYETIERTVVDVAAHTREVTVPAEYATVEVRKLIEPERIERTEVPPQYSTVTRLVEKEPAFTKWERVLCQESIHPTLAFKIEQRLQDKGFNPGSVDGSIDAKAEQAIESYQMDQGMAKGGITPKTLESLGIIDFAESKEFAVSQM